MEDDFYPAGTWVPAAGHSKSDVKKPTSQTDNVKMI
jgi:hypothetical protein